MDAKRLHTPEGTPPAHRVLAAPSHGEVVLNTMYKLYQEGQLCDYTITAEGQSFHTHRNILAAVSDYFRAMLTGAMLEARQDHVDLKGVSANAVHELLEFAYTGHLPLNMDDVMDVLAGACHLQMKSAIRLCAHFLGQEISCKSCVDILNMTEMFALSDVKDKAFSFVVDNFDKIADSDQFYKLHRDHLCSLLQSDRLPCSTEHELFNHVIRWIDVDRETRTKDVFELMQHIRFSMMKAEELVDHVSQTFIMVSDAKCRTFLEEALHYQVLPNRHPLMQTPRTRVRNEPTLIAFGGRRGMNIGYKYNSNKMFALHEGKWHKLADTESNFLYASVVVVDNFMYVCGGMGKPAHARATCQRYDPRCGSWSRLAHMNTRRQSFPLVAYHGKLYAFGGGMPLQQSLEHPPTENVETYIIETNEWKICKALPEKRKSASACEIGGKIYVSGGRTENETMCTFWCYDVEKDSWQDCSPMLLPHAGHAMFAIDQKIFVMDRNNGSVEYYTALSDEWTKVAAPSVTITGVARPTVCGPWVYFISYIKEGQEHPCKRYNVLTSVWEDLPAYPEQVYCVMGAMLALPRTMLQDTNNNS